MKSLFHMALGALLLGSVAIAHSDLVPVDTPAEPGSLAPGLTELGDGRAVLTWLEPHDGGHALRFSVFDGETFGPAGQIAAGDDWFANWADTPALFALANGDWIAHWLAKSGPATFAYDVIFSRSRDEGRNWSEPVVPHGDGTQTEHGFVSYFAWDEHTAGMVWLDGRNTAGAGGESHDAHGHHGDMTLRTARVGPGIEVSDSQLLDGRVCDCCQTASAMTTAGPVVAYRGRSEDEIRDIRITRHVDGRWSEPVKVHEDGWHIGGCPVNGPDIAANDNEVTVAWFTMPEGSPRVRVARSVDVAQSFQLVAELGVDSALGRVALAPWRSGHVLLWMDQPGSSARLMMTVLGEYGQERVSRELINLEGSRASGFPQVISIGDGNGLLLAWTESGPDRGRQVRVGRLEAEWLESIDQAGRNP